MDIQNFVFDRKINIPNAPAYNDERFQSTLGALADLPGKWEGKGFNTIWRPHKALNGEPPKQDRFLELNLTTETLEFEEIKGPIPNRGLLQGDIQMFGVTYLQKISDLSLGGIHIEPGIWASIPPTENPAEGPTVARMASIPHGTTILAQGKALTVEGKPPIADVSITPFVIGNPSRIVPFPESDLSKATLFRSPTNAEITQDMVNNPNLVLSSVLKGQTVTKTIALIVSTTAASPISGGGTDSTAFLQGSSTAGANAAAASVSAIFWIETVAADDYQPGFLQLQYTQTVLLNFNGLSWPHVSVATLRKVNP